MVGQSERLPCSLPAQRTLDYIGVQPYPGLGVLCNFNLRLGAPIYIVSAPRLASSSGDPGSSLRSEKNCQGARPSLRSEKNVKAQGELINTPGLDKTC